MSESTVTADSTGPHPSAQVYTWEVPEKPVAIHLSLEVVERLDRDVLQTFRAITSRGSEVGGILLGRIEDAGKLTVVIEDYEPVPCDYRRGPLYLLAEADRRRLEEALARRKQDGERKLSVVGYYRSNTRKELALDDDDFSIISEYFSEPHNVFLLIKPFASKTNQAGFFIWENGAIERRSSYLTFPFSRSELSKGTPAAPVLAAAPPRVPIQPAGPNAAGPERPRASVPPKPECRAVDEKTMPPRPPEKSAPAAATPPKSVLAEALKPGPEPAGTTAPKPEKLAETLKTPAEPPPVSAKPAVPVPEEAKKPAESEPLPVPFLYESSRPSAAPSFLRSRWLWISLALIIAIAAGVVGYMKFGLRAPAGTGEDPSSLALRVERNGGQLLLTWNRNATLLQTAQRAILSITDGEHREDVELDLTQLRSGSIVYSPLTSDVSFRLEVTDLTKGKSLSESVRVLAGRPSPAGPPATEAAKPGAPAAPPGQQAAAPKAPETPSGPGSGATSPDPAGAAPASAGQAAPSQPATEQPKAMTPPPAPPLGESLAARLSPAEPLLATEPPKVEIPTALGKPAPPPSPPTTQETKPAAEVPEPKPATPPPTQAAKPGSSPLAQQPKPAATEPAKPADEAPRRVGGAVQEARIISRRTPVYPPLARQARLQGVVRLQAVIGPNGRVEKVEAISGPPLLRQAAIDAVKQWVYQPSLLNGQPVRVVTQIDVNFTLER